MRVGFTGRRLVTVVVLASGLLAACEEGATAPSGSGQTTAGRQTSTAASGDTVFAGDEHWIAYQTDRGGSEGIWLIHPDGTEDHQVATDLSGGQLLPDWSPDGTRVAFATRGVPGEPLFEYDLTTQTSRQLFACVDPCLGDDEPVYSNDGASMAFIRALGRSPRPGRRTAACGSVTWRPVKSGSSPATRGVSASTSRAGLRTTRS